MEIRTVDLKNYSSLRVGGEGNMITVTTLAELVEAVMYAKKEGLRIHTIGDGTNTFFADQLIGILFIKMNIKGVSFEEKDDSVYLTASSGEIWDDIVKFTVSKNLWGLENLSYIPGTVGATAVQNIGAYGVELKDVFVSLQALSIKTLTIIEIDKNGCNFGYRDSLFKQEKGDYIIISITVKLSIKSSPVLTYIPLDTLSGKENLAAQEVRNLVITIRKSKLPDWKEYPNTGSFFKNPVVGGPQGVALRAQYPDIPLIKIEEGYKIPAAWCIEHVAAMKGLRTGNIGTWPTQPLVIVNYGEATAKDIIDFSNVIITKIENKTGIKIEREVNYVT